MRSKFMQYKDRWIDEVSNGTTYANIASAYGCSQGTVCRVISENGYKYLPPDPPDPKYIPEYDIWIDLHNDGMSPPSIANECDVPIIDVYEAIGFNTNSGGIWGRYKKYYDDWAEMYGYGMSLTQIAATCGCDTARVWQVLHKMGIELRDHGAGKTLSYVEKRDGYDYFDVIDTEHKSYHLGYIHGDGCIADDAHRLHINLSIRDISYLEQLASIFNRPVQLYNIQKGDKVYEMCMLRVNSVHLCNSLIDKGIYPRKTYIDTIEVFNHVPDELVHHFIRGTFDADGHASVILPQCRIGFAGRRVFLDVVHQIIQDSTNAGLGRWREHGTIFELLWTRRTSIHAIGEYMYKDATIYLQRKRDKFITVEGLLR